MPVVMLFLLLVLATVLALVLRALRRTRRADFIRQFTLPQGLFDKLRQRHPQLTLKDCQLVAQALRQFFLAHLASQLQQVSMPSQVTDDLWHEFILYTRNYEAFCRQAFGRFMHHTPAAAMGGQRRANAGLRRCWWQCCRAENINPRKPTRLPLLFAIDAKLAIVGGFVYQANCAPARGAAGSAGATAIYCGGDFSDASFDGSTDGLGDSGQGGQGASDGADGGGGDGGGCGGGCGS